MTEKAPSSRPNPLAPPGASPLSARAGAATAGPLPKQHAKPNASAPPPNAPKRVRILHAARQHMNERRWKEAIAELKPLTEGKRPDGEALFLMAICYENSDRLSQARKLAEQSIAILPHPDAKLIVARAMRQAGETDACLDLCNEVIASHPHLPTAKFVRIGALEEAGRFDDALAELEPLLDTPLADTVPLKVEHAKLLIQRKKHDEGIALSREVIEATDPENEKLIRAMHQLIAKAADRSKRYDEAFEAATLANNIGRVEYNPAVHEQQVATLIENWSAENIAAFPESACESEVPVFVAGMPRSGTSLIDQIIDAHPKAAGVGELNTIEQFAGKLSRVWDPTKPAGKQFGKYDAYRWTRVADEYVKEILAQSPPGTERVVNKALGNNKLVGLLARLFPKTRIIHAMRDPRDVSISCYMGGFNNNLHPWTTRIDWTSNSWNLSHQMMQHWKDSLDVPILDVYYEELVRDPQTQFPRIIEFLGLEWDDACFDFYKSKRTVRTLSYDQVNRPIYTSSAGRNANYAKHIEGIDFFDYDPHAADS